jgi:hypothetical protein
MGLEENICRKVENTELYMYCKLDRRMIVQIPRMPYTGQTGSVYRANEQTTYLCIRVLSRILKLRDERFIIFNKLLSPRDSGGDVIISVQQCFDAVAALHIHGCQTGHAKSSSVPKDGKHM